MKLSNQFTVPAPVDRAWDVLLDLERVAPCLPGAQLERGDGRDFQGQMSIKVGPVTTRYKGTVRIEEADADARRAVMRAQARDARDAGTAAATIATVMRPVDEGTLVAVETDIQISGPAAQFGRGVMQEVSSKLMARFAECLAEEMGAGYEETPVGRLPTGPAADAALVAARVGQAPALRGRPTDEVLDLGEISRGAVLKRAIPPALLAAAAIAVLAVWRRHR